ncbi:MAG: DNA polymerase III subunit gamma/tau [Bilophila sp.]
MSHASLATRYRPQSFAEVTGQDTVKAILSRAAAQDRVAPAYLLSGTRGVGKTTIARIFAKALNCEHAPVGEPCNQCAQCRRITQGNHVDVIEIDGASNRGIDDARRLRETIAYAPMEGRYKVFIIDEAHMLTRESFNALLKTLEEPPPRVTFILATTEAHKFPVTIVSRCQHFVFKALPEAELVAHLVRILNKEKLPYEESAVRLLARRAAGSVRDSMSLLGQTLALGGDSLTEAATRSVLGLAGQELYERLLEAFKAQDCLAVAALTQELLERGVDLGFFLRELATLWRNLFLIRQAGEAASSALDMPEAEMRRLMELAPQFEPAYIHAAWQMVLESQRQVLTSLEPSAALELLLLNLALLPRLVSLEVLSRAVPTGGTGTPGPPVPPCPLQVRCRSTVRHRVTRHRVTRHCVTRHCVRIRRQPLVHALTSAHRGMSLTLHRRRIRRFRIEAAGLVARKRTTLLLTARLPCLCRSYRNRPCQRLPRPPCQRLRPKVTLQPQAGQVFCVIAMSRCFRARPCRSMPCSRLLARSQSAP